MLCTWGMFVEEVCDFSCQGIQNSIFHSKFQCQASHRAVWTLSHVFPPVLLLYIPISHSKGIRKRLYQTVAFRSGSLASPRFSKEKGGVSRFHLSARYRQSSTQFEIKGSVATSDRVELSHAWMQPCGTRLLTDPLHHLVSAAHWRTGCEEKADLRLTYRGGDRAPVCAVVPQHQVTHYWLFDKEDGGSIGELRHHRVGRQGHGRNGMETSETSPLIDSWYLPGGDHDTIPTDLYVLMEECLLQLSVCSTRLTSACRRTNIIQRDDSEPAVSPGTSLGDWHIVEFFNSAGGARLGLVFRRVIWWNRNKGAILSSAMKKPGQF